MGDNVKNIIASLLAKYLRRTTKGGKAEAVKQQISLQVNAGESEVTFKQGNTIQAMNSTLDSHEGQTHHNGFGSGNETGDSPLRLPDCSETLQKTSIDVPGLSDDIKRQLREALVAAELKGEGIEEIERNIRGFLTTDFKWPEFDKWCRIFRKDNAWPYLWDDVGYYIYLKECSIEELTKELKKDQLFTLAEKYQLKVKKSTSKKELINILNASIPKEDRKTVFDIVNQDWYPAFLKAKRLLLCHHLLFSAVNSVEEIRNQYPDGIVKYIEILATGDSCSFCQKKDGKKYRLSSIKKEDLPPYHIGCRCCTAPIVKD